MGAVVELSEVTPVKGTHEVLWTLFLLIIGEPNVGLGHR